MNNKDMNNQDMNNQDMVKEMYQEFINQEQMYRDKGNIEKIKEFLDERVKLEESLVLWVSQCYNPSFISRNRSRSSGNS